MPQRHMELSMLFHLAPCTDIGEQIVFGPINM